MNGMRPTLSLIPFLRDKVKLLRYLGVTKTLKFDDVLHPHFTAVNQCSRVTMPETKALINLYSMGKTLGSVHMNNQNIVSLDGDALQVVGLFKSMLSKQHEDESYPPNNYMCGLVLSYCLDDGYLLLGRQCHGYMLKSGFVLNQHMKNALVCLYSMSSDVVGAMEVAIRLDIYSYNQMLIGLVEEDYLDEALIILKRMWIKVDVVWNKATYIGIFSLCGSLQDLDLGRRFHSKFLKSSDFDDQFDESVCTELIKMYGKCKHIATAATVFDIYEARNGVIWTSMLAALLEHDKLYDKLLILFLDMRHEDVAPNESTFCILLYASAGLESMRFGKLIHALAHKTGFNGHKVVKDALINMYSRTGDIVAAEKVFSGITSFHRDTKTWNMMIGGYLFHGLGYESLALFQEMLEIGKDDPDTYTFLSVLNACAQLKLVKEGYYYLNEFMKQKGVEPGLEHYLAIVGMLTRAGRLDEALNFIVSTPVKWSKYAWLTLIRGCLRRYDSSLFTRVVELIPYDVETKVGEYFRVRKLRVLSHLRERRELESQCTMEIKTETYIFDRMDFSDGEIEYFHKVVDPLFLGYLLGSECDGTPLERD